MNPLHELLHEYYMNAGNIVQGYKPQRSNHKGLVASIRVLTCPYAKTVELYPFNTSSTATAPDELVNDTVNHNKRREEHTRT